jgi:autotransporter-associated beta strand protein
VTVSGGVNVAAGMTFSTDGYTVTNSTITLTGANAASNTITAAASIGTTISSQLAGANGMTKAGTGTVTLSGTNSYTGATIVNQGTLELAFSGDNNAGVGTIAVGSDITVNAGGTLLGSAVNALGSATGHTVDGTTDQLTINEGGQLRVGAGTVLSMPYALNVVGGTISSVDGGHPSFGTIFYGSTEGTFTSSSGGTAATISAQNFNLQGASFNVVQGGGPVDLSITGNLIGNALTKNGNGVMVLSGNNTYSGGTTVEAGKLVVNGSISGATTVQSGATLGGSGTIGGPTTISGTLAPGNSLGALTLTNGLTLSGGGNYNWQIFGLTGTAGQTNTWDLIDVTGGTWDISGLSSTNKFNINLWSLGTLPDTTGAVAGFDATQTYSWKILASVGLSTNSIFNAAYFNINTSAINGTGGFVGATGLFSLELDGNNDLFLNYTGAGAAVPEPGTWAAAVMLVAAAGLRRALRRKAAFAAHRHGLTRRLSPFFNCFWVPASLEAWEVSRPQHPNARASQPDQRARMSRRRA